MDMTPTTKPVIANAEVEAAFLGAAILDPMVAPFHTEIPVEAFYMADHQTVWRAILGLLKEGYAPDMTRVAARLSDEKQGEKRSLVVTLVDSCISSAGHQEYAKMILDKYNRRRLEAFQHKASSIAHDMSDPGWKETAQRQFFELFKSHTEKKGTRSIGKAIDEAFEIPNAILTGINELDDAWGNAFAPGNLITMAGRPGSGKTSFACWLSLVLACRQQNVLFHSAEMRRGEIIRRMVGALLQVNHSEILARHKAGDPIFEKAVEKVTGLPLLINDEATDMSHVIVDGRSIGMRFGLDLLIVDHLHHLVHGQGENAMNSAAAAVHGLKQLAVDLNIPVVMLAQLNRGVEGRTDKRPTLADLRQFGVIEEVSDMVIGLYRDEYYDNESVDKGTSEVIVMKNRHGQTGTVKLITDIAKCLYCGGAQNASANY